MPETIIESVLNGKLDSALLIKWLNNESIDDAPDDCILLCCKRNEFVAYFLSYLRNQTDSVLQTNSNAVQILQNSTPEKLKSRQHHRSISDPTAEERSTDTLTVKQDYRSHESPSRDRKRQGRRVKTKLFPDNRESNLSISSDESKLSLSADRITISSTPLKNGTKPFEHSNLSLTSPITPKSFVKDSYERCDTPRVSRHSRSHEKSCLGDYLVTAKSSKKKSKKNTSSDKEDKPDLDLSNSEIFPEIGARKSSSLRSEKRRIKPTNIDKSQKSLSLNSFNTESFQQPPLALEDNSAFSQLKYQPKEANFDAERNLLKQERHKLMEKFNFLNTSTPAKTPVMPQIKINQKESVEKPNYIKADANKVVLREKIDLLIELYNILLKNNLILSINTEIYFLVSILISKQLENDYLIVEKELENGNVEYLLRSVHNSSYFAVKALWNERATLEIILDKNSLKTLGENKKVRSFYPDLAKFLLNCYCVRCERPTTVTRVNPPAVVCYNFETDNVDNFPGTSAFHNFKKQRDMFYEIVRWYQDTTSVGGSVHSFRARVKALLSCGGVFTYGHLATLLVQHMLCACLNDTTQESKLSKLQRRLTCPTAPDTNRLPTFTTSEKFYKEFILNAENESFRVHLKDVISTEILMLDGTHLATEDRGNSNSTDITQEYLKLAKKLCLLSKFLGYLTSLPYSQIPTEIVSKNNNLVVLNKENNYTAPKEKVLENRLALRNYSQPNIDLIGVLNNALDSSRLSITIPWIVHYLSMLDYTTLRLNYYQNLLKILLFIYHNRLKNDTTIKKNTLIYLKSILGWLFDLPHFPSELSECSKTSVGTEGIDSCNLIDESTILELCPSLKDINVLLSTCRLSQDRKEVGSFRHITPVSLNVNPEDRLKNKEKELQTRLEEEFLRSQPSSWRRVVEIVSERAAAGVLRELASHELPRAVRHARQQATLLLAEAGGTHKSRLEQLQALYATHLQQLRANALELAKVRLRNRTRDALSALLPVSPVALQTVACRNALNRLTNWLNDHWSTTAILCKNIESEMAVLSSMADLPIRARDVTPPPRTPSTISLANHFIELKEHICLVLEDILCDWRRLLTQGAALSRSPLIRIQHKRAHAQLTLDMCIVYVAKRPKEVTESFLNKLHAIWNVYCPDRKRNSPETEVLSPERNFDDDRIPTPISDDENSNLPSKVPQKQENNQILKPPSSPVTGNRFIYSNLVGNSPNLVGNSSNLVGNSSNLVGNSSNLVGNSSVAGLNSPSYLNSPGYLYTGPHSPVYPLTPPGTTKPSSPNTKAPIHIDEENDIQDLFNRILCPRNIVLLSASKVDQCSVWAALASVLVFLLNNDYLSEDSLTEQCLAVYRQDWTQDVLANMSVCMKTVSSRWSCAGKLSLFLDFLAEYCGDM